jgi:hypothetical protein
LRSTKACKQKAVFGNIATTPPDQINQRVREAFFVIAIDTSSSKS